MTINHNLNQTFANFRWYFKILKEFAESVTIISSAFILSSLVYYEL